MKSRYKKSFASDNNSPIHPKVLEAINIANSGHCLSYGEDKYTESAIIKFKEVFGETAQVFFVFNGTGANVTALAAMGSPFNGVLCARSAHINIDECGAFERFTGAKLITFDTSDGKLRPEQLAPALGAFGEQHHSQPKIISITQSTEVGTVYTIDELKRLTDFAHRNNLYVHMDGARIANAAASLGVSLKAVTADAGIDVLSFGGTKNGLMIGEAVVFFNSRLAENYKYIRKQGMQLASKMRYIAVQFEALLEDDLWLKNASQANRMAALLAQEVSQIPEIRIVYPVEANGLFVTMPRESAKKLMEKYYFYAIDEEKGIYRWMTSFDMEEEDIMDFVAVIKEVI